MSDFIVLQTQIQILAQLYELTDSSSVKTKESYDECIKLLYGDSTSTELKIIHETIYVTLSDEDAGILFKDFSETNILALQILVKELLYLANVGEDITGNMSIYIGSAHNNHTIYGTIGGFFREGKLRVGQVLLLGYVDIEGFFVDDMLQGYGKIEDTRTKFLNDKPENDTIPENFIYEGEFLYGMFHGQGTITKKFIDVDNMRKKIEEQEGRKFKVFIGPQYCHNQNSGRIITSGTFYMGNLQEKGEEYEYDSAFATTTTTENSQISFNDILLNLPIRAKL
jgi:hypothetical protein